MQHRKPNPVFDDIQAPNTTPIKVNRQESADSPKPKRKAKRKHIAANKINVCYCVTESLRDDLQAASFMLRKTQSDIITEAVTYYIKKKNIQLPKRVA